MGAVNGFLEGRQNHARTKRNKSERLKKFSLRERSPNFSLRPNSCLDGDIMRAKLPRVKAKKDALAVTLPLSSNYPRVLQSACVLFPDLLATKRYARVGCLRGMRSDRRANFSRLLRVLLSSVSLQHDGAVCAINGRSVRPLTREDMSLKSGLSVPTVDRLLEQLRQWGYLTSKQIKRKNIITGKLEVSPGLRFFTEKFWQELRLLDVFKKSVSWAKKHCSRSFSLHFKTISAKAKEVFSTARETLKPVLKSLRQNNGKIQDECHKILTMLRQRK